MDNKAAKSQRDQIIAQIKEYSPTFRPFFELDKGVQKYSRQIYEFEKNATYIKRQELIKEKILQKFSTLFGDNCQEELHINFSDQLCLNIVDHHAMLNHPLLIGSNVISHANDLISGIKQNAIVVLTSGDVPPNNYFNRNGFQLHEKRVPIFSNSEREFCTYFIDKREFDFVKRLQAVKRWDEFSRDEKEFLEGEQHRVHAMDFSTCADYKDQITVHVKETWPLLFEKSLRSNLPELLFISQEELGTLVLQDLLKEDNFVSQILFEKDFREYILDMFRGNVITWNEKENKGTHFFWRKHPTQPKALRLYVKGDILEPQDKRFEQLSIKLDREEILHLLEKREIYPSLFTIFSALTFYAGVKPQVGQGSLNYMNQLRELWLKVFAEKKMHAEVRNLKSLKIDSLIAGINVFYKQSVGGFEFPYAFDLIHDGGFSKKNLEKLFSMKLSDLLSTSILGIYDYVAQKFVPENKRIKATITDKDLARLAFG